MKKGVALLWSLILIIVLMITSGVMVNYIIKESQSSVRIEESTRAYAAAKSGIDWGQDYVKKNKSLPSITKTLTIDLEQNVKAEVSFNGDLSSYTITSVGIVGNKVKRAIDQKSSNFGYTPVPLSSPTNGLNVAASNTDSFTLLFDFWMGDTGPTTPWVFGLSSTNAATPGPADSYIAFINKGNQLAVRIKRPNYSPDSDSDILVLLADYVGRDKMARVKLEYIEDIGVSLRLYGHFDKEGECQKVVNIPLMDEMNDLKYLYTSDMTYDASIPAAVQPTNAAYFQNLFFKSN